MNLLCFIKMNAPIIASIASAVAAIFSFTITKKNYKYLRNKESLNISIVPNENLKIINIIENKPNEKFLKEFFNKYYFEIINLSSLPINMLNITLDVPSLNKKLFNKETPLASHFQTLGGASRQNPDIALLQQHNITSQLDKSSILPNQKEKIERPLNLMKEFLQFSYQINKKGDQLEIKNSLDIQITYYDQTTTKIRKKKEIIPYTMLFRGTRAIIEFEFKPKIIYLNKNK